MTIKHTRIDESFVLGLLPKRTDVSHKYNNGYLSTFVGSDLFPGAARLATHAAARVGAGGVVALLQKSTHKLVAMSLPPEIMMRVIKSVDDIDGAAQTSKAFLLGCGLGQSKKTKALATHILETSELPMVIDADALAFLKPGMKDKPWILTPHQGELQRLLILFEQIDPISLSQHLGMTILVKGFPSHIFTPDGVVYQNTTGNPAASTAGCGDVLAGIIAGLLAQGLSPRDAACAGIFYAGKAADLWVQENSSHSLMASDIIALLPRVLK